MARPHHGLMAWQEAMDIARTIYALTGGFPRDERFGLTAQLRRAAVSVPSNIAEGCARGSSREMLRFLHIARGSLSELDTQLRLASDFGFCDSGPALGKVENLFSRLAALIRASEIPHSLPRAAKPPADKPRSGAHNE
jgi:four helix bundle protein